MTIYYPPTQNAIQKTLDAQLLEGITASMTLNNVIGIANKPGVCVVDFVDTNNKETPTKREYIAFTGVSGNTLTGLTRNADGGGTDQDHSVGAIVQFPPDILQQKAIIDTFTVEHGQDGKHTSAVVTSLKATGAEVTTGTEDAKIVTPKALADSDYAKTTDITVTADSTTTFSNKRTNPRIVTAASYTTDTGTALDVSTCDEFDVTAQAGDLKLNNPGGTPVNGQKLIVRIKDNGTARALTYDTQYRASTDLALPTTTVVNKTLYMGFIWNSADTKWDLLAVLNNI